MVDFHASSRKSKNFHFDRILLSKAYKDLDEKIQKSYVSWHWRVIPSLKKNWLLVPKWHEEFGEFSLNHSKVQKFFFSELFCPKYRSHLLLLWTAMQNLNKPWSCGFKNGIKIGWTFLRSLKSLKNYTLMGSFRPRHIMLQLEGFRGIICHDTEGWCKI